MAIIAVAIAATVVATWASVADAPWEDDATAVVDDGTDNIRCEGALSFRDSIVEAGEYEFGRGIAGAGNPDGVKDYDEQLAKAESEIDRYC